MNKSKIRRGKLIRDECADRKLEEPTRKAGWNIESLKPSDRSIGLTDPYILEKYTKGRYGILTRDFKMYSQTEGGAIGYVEHGNFTKDEFREYAIKYTKFLSGITARDIKNKVWHIPRIGEPFQKIKNLSQYGKKKLLKK